MFLAMMNPPENVRELSFQKNKLDENLTNNFINIIEPENFDSMYGIFETSHFNFTF